MFVSRLPALVVTLALPIAAQPPVLAPTANVTISTASPLYYASIHVLAGVAVTFTGANPALLRCDCDVIIDGTVLAVRRIGSRRHKARFVARHRRLRRRADSLPGHARTALRRAGAAGHHAAGSCGMHETSVGAVPLGCIGKSAARFVRRRATSRVSVGPGSHGAILAFALGVARRRASLTPGCRAPRARRHPSACARGRCGNASSARDRARADAGSSRAGRAR